jgi:STE24 endopeptidase
MTKFDPQAATAQYIDSLGPSALAKAHAYTLGGHWLILWGVAVSAIVTLIIVRSGALDRISARIGERRRALRAFVISVIFFLASALLSLPWSIYEGWWREKSYARTNQPLGDFLGQAALSTLISSIVAALFMIGVYWLIRRTGRRWWLWSGALTAVAMAFIMLLSPVLVEPLFNTYQPIPAGPVHDAVASMAARAGIPENKIYMYNGSRQSNNFTANAGGVGSTARVESPRGETVCVVETEMYRVRRLHLRTGSYANWPSLALATAGNLLPDFPLINKSFELCYACVDR